MVVDIAILCPVEVEFEAVRQIISAPRAMTTPNYQFSYELGQIHQAHGSWNIALIEPNLAHPIWLNTSEVIQILNPRFLILVGIAGGVKDAKIGDLVIGTTAYDYEFGKETPEGFVARPRALVNTSSLLMTIARRLARELKRQAGPQGNPRIIFGPIASGHKILSARKRLYDQLIKQHYNDTQAVEMEAYNFALVASRAKVPYLNIRGISDLLDGKSEADAAGSQQMAAQRAATFLQQLILRLPLPTTHEQDTAFAVQYTFEKKRAYQIRTIKRGQLRFNPALLQLISAEQQLNITNIQRIEYMRMPGDLAKNWIALHFWAEEQLRIIYLASDGLLPGWNNWTGGSRSLFQALSSFSRIVAPAYCHQQPKRHRLHLMTTSKI